MASPTIHVRYTGDLKTSCTHLRSGNSFTTDAPVDNNGTGSAFSPTDLIATSALACQFTVVGIKRRQQGLPDVGMSGTVTKHMGAGPRRIVKLEFVFRIANQADFDEVKAQLQAAMQDCPVLNSLDSAIEVTAAFEQE